MVNSKLEKGEIRIMQVKVWISNEWKLGSLVKENNKTLIIKLNDDGNIIKRHKVKHRIIKFES